VDAPELADDRVPPEEGSCLWPALRRLEGRVVSEECPHASPIASLELASQFGGDFDVLLRHRPRSIPEPGRVARRDDRSMTRALPTMVERARRPRTRSAEHF
jgi:hypothetical protein